MAAQWGRIRQSYMSGKSYKELSEKYGVSVKTIQNRAYKEGWTKEKGKIEEEVGQKIHERVVRVRVRELEKLMDANGQLIDTLVALTLRASDPNQTNAMMFDKAGSMKNVEALAKAIQTAVQTQRDLFNTHVVRRDHVIRKVFKKHLAQCIRIYSDVILVVRAYIRFLAVGVFN